MTSPEGPRAAAPCSVSESWQMLAMRSYLVRVVDSCRSGRRSAAGHDMRKKHTQCDRPLTWVFLAQTPHCTGPIVFEVLGGGGEGRGGAKWQPTQHPDPCLHTSHSAFHHPANQVLKTTQGATAPQRHKTGEGITKRHPHGRISKLFNGKFTMVGFFSRKKLFLVKRCTDRGGEAGESGGPHGRGGAGGQGEGGGSALTATAAAEAKRRSKEHMWLGRRGAGEGARAPARARPAP